MCVAPMMIEDAILGVQRAAVSRRGHGGVKRYVNLRGPVCEDV
jgi:hypothetical protein